MTKCETWQYLDCLENVVHTIAYTPNASEIKTPIFDYGIPLKVVDSLCNKLFNDFEVQLYNTPHITLETFGEYYFSDSVISIAISEIHLINEREFSYKVRISEAKYNLSEHNSYVMIYVPKIGIVYAMFPNYENPKVARLMSHCQISKGEWERKFREITMSYILLDCFNR